MLINIVVISNISVRRKNFMEGLSDILWVSFYSTL